MHCGLSLCLCLCLAACSFVQSGSSLVKQLALGSVQMCGAGLYDASPLLSPCLRDVSGHLTDNAGEGERQRCVSLAAGLFFFTTHMPELSFTLPLCRETCA